MFSSPLFTKVFLIISCMLVITAITAQINRAFETRKEYWLTLIGSFITLIAIFALGNSFPLNLILVALFSGFMGWSIGPTISYLGSRYQANKEKKKHNLSLEEFNVSLRNNHLKVEDEWNKVVSTAIFATAGAVAATAFIVAFTDKDFSFLGGFLFIALLILVITGFINAFFIKSSKIRLIKSYCGVVIFTLYLLYDFNTLEKMAKNDSWSVAINIAVQIYLDIINLFLSLLEILANDN